MSKIYVVVETYRDYKSVFSCVWGASTSETGAALLMQNGIKERYEYLLEDEDFDFDSFIKEQYESKTCWVDDNSDDYTEFAIHEVELSEHREF